MAEESIVKKVIENLRSYLQNNLSIDEDFIEDLQGQAGDLLHKRDADRIRSSLSKGGTQALGSLLDHMAAYYVDETLETFCAFLDDYSKRAKRPILLKIGAKIRAEMKKHHDQPSAVGQTDPQKDGDLVPTVRGELVFSKIRAGQLHQIEDLREDMLPQFEQLQTSQVSQEQFSTLKGTLCKDHLDTIEKSVEGYQKVAAFLKDSGLLEGKSSLSIDLCQLAVEQKAEVDSMLEVLQTKQKELQSDEHSSQILKGKRHDFFLMIASEKKESEINLTKDDTYSEVSASDFEAPQERSLQLSGGGTTECEDELFALAYEDGVKDKYMCHIYEKSERFSTTTMNYPYSTNWMYTTTQLHMVITYSTSHWSQIVRKYCKPDGEDWKLRTVIQDFTVEGDVLTANMPESSGPNWSCFIDGIDQVPTSSLDFTKRFPLEKDGPKLLEQAVKSSLYPPKIDLMASSNVHAIIDYNRSRLVCLEIAGSSPGIQIPVRIVDRVKPGMREPEEVSKPDSDREAHEEESSSEEDVSSPSMKTGKHLPPAVQKSGMLEPPLKTKAATILSASSKEKDQQAN